MILDEVLNNLSKLEKDLTDKLGGPTTALILNTLSDAFIRLERLQFELHSQKQYKFVSCQSNVDMFDIYEDYRGTIGKHPLFDAIRVDLKYISERGEVKLSLMAQPALADDARSIVVKFLWSIRMSTPYGTSEGCYTLPTTDDQLTSSLRIMLNMFWSYVDVVDHGMIESSAGIPDDYIVSEDGERLVYWGSEHYNMGLKERFKFHDLMVSNTKRRYCALDEGEKS
jgi:hypothetical protein